MDGLTRNALPVEQPLSPRNATSFLDSQRVSSQRIGFSVTQACPLRCAHCSVEASPELGKTTFTPAFAHQVAEQLPDLFQMGIRYLDFTGGEPTLARNFVQIVSKAADDAGMTCGLVTAAHWAKSAEGADSFLRAFPHVHNWDISTDIYHLPFVPFDFVANGYAAIRARGGSVQLRIAHHEPISFEEAKLIWQTYQMAGRQISFQPIGPVGRGKDVAVALPVSRKQRDPTPCPSTGLLIRNDGLGAPCCAPLSHEAAESPLFMGNAFVDALGDMLTRWRLQPLLQTIRLWGFEVLEQWLAEEGIPERRHYRERVCDECVSMLTDPVTVQRLNKRASTLESRIDLAIALKRDFGETWMADALKHEAQDYLNGERHVWA